MKKTILVVCMMLVMVAIPVGISSDVETKVDLVELYPAMQGNYDTEFKLLEKTSHPKTTSFDLPSEFSWLDYMGYDFITPVKSQGSCGSCWAFATVGAIEAQYNIKGNDPNLDLDLSEQYILSCLEAGSCRGGWPDDALEQIRDGVGSSPPGIVKENCFPYTGLSSTLCDSKCDDWQQRLLYIEDYDGSYFADDELDLIKQWIIEKGPLLTYMYITQGFRTFGHTHHDPLDVFTGPHKNSLNHVVVIVGYKDDPTIPTGGYWIVKNSWGTDWGYDGFINMAYDSLGIDEQCFWVSIPESFDVYIIYQPEVLTKDDIIQFYGEANKVVVSWWWDFGDGYYSDLQNPVHCYYEDGQYTVSLMTTSANGLTSTATMVIAIPGIQSEVDFSWHPTNPTIEDEIQFTDESSGNIQKWDWYFDDGSMSELRNPLHKYQAYGVYDVVLTINDLHICTKSVEVFNLPPVADFAWIDGLDSILFTDFSYDLDGTIVAWFWDYGDGTTSTEPDAEHIFPDYGEYTITLTVTDNEGLTSSLSKVIFIVSLEESVDQQQTEYYFNFKVYSNIRVAQSFKPSSNILTKVDVYIKRYNINEDIIVSIRESLDEHDLTAITKTSDEIGVSYEWTSFDFDDIMVNPEQTYYIVVQTSGGNYFKHYTLGFDAYTAYDDGKFYKNSGSLWTDYSCYDFCFKTYGY